MFIIILIAATALMPQFDPYASGQTVTELVDTPPLPLQLVPSLKFKGIAIEVEMVNATYVEIMIVAEMANPSNQTIQYTVDFNVPQRYVSYPFGAVETRLQPRMEIKAVSEKMGELDVTVDRWGNARASGSIEADGVDVVRVEGWMVLTQSRSMIWRESTEGNIGFSIDTRYEGIISPDETEVKVKFTYPAEYTKADEVNYKVEYIDGRKVIEYSEEFYGGFWLSLDIYKPRIPINSLILFSALWGVLIVFIVWTRRKHFEE